MAKAAAVPPGGTDITVCLKRSGVVALLLLFLAACGTTANFDRYSESITAFKTATDQTSAAVAAHILTIRDVDRERMFAQLTETKNPCDLTWVALRKKTSDPLEPSDCAFLAIEIVREGRFSREAIAARSKVFDVINHYTTLLSAIAESDAPARWDTAAKGLGAGAASLAETLNSLDEEDTREQLGKLTALVGEDGPLTQLISFAGQEWINFRRAQALDSAIRTGKPQIDRISRLLRADFDFVRKRNRFVTDQELGDVIFAYAEATTAAVADPTKNAARKSALVQVKSALGENETKLAEIQSIGSAMDAFDDAHAALAAYAESAKEPQDLSSLVDAIQRYAVAAKEVHKAFKTATEE